MKPAPIPSDEAARLAALAEYAILDTDPEEHFDALTRLAALLLEVPIALVSLVDVDRQWFKSTYGLDVRETPRDVSFCGHVVDMKSTLVVADSRLDTRFADNPFVIGEAGVRFYVGVPLRDNAGHVLGTLCVIDHRPRELTPLQLEALKLLAGQVVALLELRRAGRLLLAEQGRVIQREKALVDQERKLHALYAGLVEGVMLHDRHGTMTSHNQAAETILGLSSAHLTDSTTRREDWLVLDAEGEPVPRERAPALLALRTGQPCLDVSMQIGMRDALRWIVVSARPLFEPGERTPYAVITTFRDVTDTRLLAERLVRHQRLVTTGTLAGGIGHEINNPLTYMLGNVALAIEELGSAGGGAPSQRIVEIIGLLEQAVEGGERVKRIVRGLKALTRDGTEVVPTDLAGVIRNAIELTTHELRDRATVELELVPLTPVPADASRLTQVLINVLLNAAQAFRESSPANRILIRTSSTPSHAVIEVVDNGPGIPPDVLPRIFDPFFTTKPPGLSPGLGLSISHGIVASHGGALECETRVGTGTTFRIALPQVPAPPEAVTRPTETRRRILVVDDEPMVLASVKRMLQGEFEVVTEGDSRVALRLLDGHEPFDGVVSDLMMPHLSGMELFEEAVRRRPELAARFVFMSGDLSRPDIVAFFARVTNARVEKPFSVGTIRELARQVVSK